MTSLYRVVTGVGVLGVLMFGALAHAQSLGFDQPGAHAVPIKIAASNGIDWDQKARTITAKGNAQAVRGSVTVTADRLVAHYAPSTGPAKRPTNVPAAGDPLGGLDSGQSQLTELDAIGNVHISSPTEQAFGDLAVYHMESGELILTGKTLRLILPSETITARKSLQYWSRQRKAVAIGDAVIVAKDHRSVAADRLTGYFDQPDAAAAAQPAAAGTPDAAGKLRKVVAEGHVVLRTATDIATGDRADYHPATGIAIVTGDVHITRGPNELAGARAEVNMKTGIATLVAAPGKRVQGLVLPNSAPPPGAAKPPQSPDKAVAP